MIIDQIVNTIANSNTYVLYNDTDKNCWLVDCGDAEILIDWIQGHHKNLAGIFITHTHFDHIYGLNLIVSAFPECIIYTSEKGKEGLYSDKLNLSRYNCNSFIYQFGNVKILGDNDTVEIFSNVFFQAISTPRHDWSCLTYRCLESIFTGDSYLPKYKVIATFPKSNKEQAERSLIKIKGTITLGAKNVYPGHGDINLFI